MWQQKRKFSRGDGCLVRELELGLSFDETTDNQRDNLDPRRRQGHHVTVLRITEEFIGWNLRLGSQKWTKLSHMNEIE